MQPDIHRYYICRAEISKIGTSNRVPACYHVIKQNRVAKWIIAQSFRRSFTSSNTN